MTLPETIAPRVPRRRSAVLRYVGGMLPHFPGRHLVLRSSAGVLGLSLASPRVIHDKVAGDLVVDPRFRGPMRESFLGLVTEPTMLSVIDGFLRPGDLVVDVGANFGGYSRRFAALVGPAGRVEAFEPNSRIFGVLKANAQIAPHANMFPHRLALGAKREQLILHVCNPPAFSRAMNDGMSTLTSRLAQLGESDEESVDVRTLDDLFPDATPALLKVDVEGWEANVLRGASDVLGRMVESRSLIVLEAHLSHNDQYADALYREVSSLCEAGMTAVMAHGALTNWTGQRINGNLLLWGRGRG